jgi:hypothetical protein
MTRVPPGTSRDDDRIDLAVIRLASECSEHLGSEDLLDMDALEVAVAGAPKVATDFFVTGYPATRQPRRMINNEYGARPFTFITEEGATAEYADAALERRTSLLVHFDKDDVFRVGTLAEGPDLFGASGGAVWRLPNASASAPLLAGIIVSWRRRAPQGIVATRSDVLRAFLASS